MSFSLSTFIFTILAFGVLYYFLNKYAFGPLFSMMEKRRQLVLDQLSQAEENQSKAKKLVDDQTKILEDVRKEAYNILEQARIMSNKQSNDAAAAAKEDAARIKKEALQDIENEKNKAIAALRAQVSGLSVLIASKIIEKQVDEQTQKELIDQYLQKSGGQA